MATLAERESAEEILLQAVKAFESEKVVEDAVLAERAQSNKFLLALEADRDAAMAEQLAATAERNAVVGVLMDYIDAALAHGTHTPFKRRLLRHEKSKLRELAQSN